MDDVTGRLPTELLLYLPLASAVVKYAISMLRGLFPKLDGGAVQAATAGLSLFAAFAVASAGGHFNDGITLQGIGQVLVMGWSLMTGANWVNEAERRVARVISRRNGDGTV